MSNELQNGVKKAGSHSLSWEEQRGVGSASIISWIGAFHRFEHVPVEKVTPIMESRAIGEKTEKERKKSEQESES